MCLLKIFSFVCGLYFNILDIVFHRVDFFNFNIVEFINCFLSWISCLCCGNYKVTTTPQAI